MTEIKSVNAPAIGQRGIERLFAMVREKNMTSEGGLFQAGYEQAKRDFRDALYREVGIPSEVRQDAEHTRTPARELRARKDMPSSTGWWGRGGQ